MATIIDRGYGPVSPVMMLAGARTGGCRRIASAIWARTIELAPIIPQPIGFECGAVEAPRLLIIKLDTLKSSVGKYRLCSGYRLQDVINILIVDHPFVEMLQIVVIEEMNH